MTLRDAAGVYMSVRLPLAFRFYQPNPNCSTIFFISKGRA